MPTLIALRRRIRSVRNSQKITRAMKTVSTAKFRKAQRMAFEGRPAWHLLPDIVARLAVWAGPDAHPLLDVRKERRAEIVVVTSDKGLAGAFNSNLLVRAHALLAEKQAAGVAARLVVLGKKASNHFRKLRYPIDRLRAEHTDRMTAEEVRDLAEFLMQQYAFQRVDAVYLVYNEFHSIVAPRLTVFRLLPLAEPERGLEPDWEPPGPGLLTALLPRYVEGQLRHALAESQAAEQAARMMAMENATKSAEEFIVDLTLVLNKIRQASITKELLEIMTAVEALKQGA
jgi:F-type H+-transporting ATPase subunit gamma